MLPKFFCFWLICGVIFKLPLVARSARRHPLRAFYTRADCFLNDTQLLTDYTCGLHEDSTGLNPFLGARFRLKHDVDNVTVHYRLTIKRNDRWDTYISTELNVCDVLGNIHSNFLLQMMFETLWQHSNLPYQCPFKKNLLYIMNVTIDSSALPPYVPELEWASYAKYYLFGRKILTVNCAGEVTRSSTEKNIEKMYIKYNKNIF